jgi:hypothetical protein
MQTPLAAFRESGDHRGTLRPVCSIALLFGQNYAGRIAI